MFISLNGKRRQIKQAMSLHQLLAELKVEARAVAIEVNENIIPRSEFSSLQIRGGDIIEILRVVGGG